MNPSDRLKADLDRLDGLEKTVMNSITEMKTTLYKCASDRLRIEALKVEVAALKGEEMTVAALLCLLFAFCEWGGPFPRPERIVFWIGSAGLFILAHYEVIR